MNTCAQKETKSTQHSSSSPTSVVSSFPSLSSINIENPDSDVVNVGAEKEDIFTLTPSSYPINLEQFIQLLPDTIRNHHNKVPRAGSVQGVSPASTSCCMKSSAGIYNKNHDPIASLFRRLTISKEELQPYSYIDMHKSYTRNLIFSDDETFTLLLLCWNPGKYSPIHDHPCNGCWMRVCQGVVNEVRYQKKTMDIHKSTVVREAKNKSEVSSQFVCTMDTNFYEGEQTFIHDNMGYHKVGNPGNQIALSMHLYSPPFNKCNIWMDPYDASSFSTSNMCNFSEYGHRIDNRY